ncbi:Surface presentation of antigens (SPOA) [Legionella maceachernii]|uniref:Surface presentation of antigens (SPOA) n=3 Tax=Legionella TaxID=445 RepID=A0A0W0W1N5_9GAMM|nr:FliM/FliN family flagellar motor C-terminal domain-containing protein [Legionella maceachernii]KTD25830.1 Surface presentation of antigens (SPOA) [Legionella maceachernii]SJZ46475.1 Type III flagellar switch regulator (C-ring) FliN C-term [Legionella maceachernii]SUP03995.1 Flagellar motor switch protein [Legionella maceachernii]
MKKNARPYRIITSSALQSIEHSFNKLLLQWNESYFMDPIMLNVSCCSEISAFSEMQLITHEKGDSIALYEPNALPFLQQTLFGEISHCFNSVSAEIFTRLLHDFLGLDSLQTTINSTHYNEWIYPGSACLNLTLTHSKGLFNFYLHSNWVLPHLPQPKKISKPLVRLDNALAPQNVNLTIQLKPLRLSLAKVLGLQVGDVIKTDHALNTPLVVQHQNQSICEAEIGQLLQHKSIQLMRS